MSWFTALPKLHGSALSAYRAAWFAMLALAVAGISAANFVEHHRGQLPGHDALATHDTLTVLAFKIASDLPLLIAAIVLFRRRVSEPVVALLSFGMLAVVAQDSAALLPDETLSEVYRSTIGLTAVFTILLGLFTFPSGKFEPRWSIIAVPILLLGISSEFWGEQLPHIRQSLEVVLSVLLLAVLGARYLALEAGQERQQFKWAGLGFAGFILLMLLLAAIQYVSPANPQLQYYLPAISAFLIALARWTFVGGLLVSLLNYRLYDADTAISRSAVYAAVTFSVIVIFAVTLRLMEVLSERYFTGDFGVAASAIAAGLAAVMIAPLHQRISAWAERQFQWDLVSLRNELPRVVADLQLIATPSDLAAAALDRIVSAVHASSGAIVRANGSRLSLLATKGNKRSLVSAWAKQWKRPPNKQGQQLVRDDVLFPFRVPLHDDASGFSGWILLGPRLDGNPYGKDDRQAVLNIAEPLARSLNIALVRHSREEGLCKRMASLEDAIARVVAKKPRRKTGDETQS